MSDLAERLASVQGSIADAARDAGRNPHDVTTIVVTKFQPVSLIRHLVELGVHDIGENRHQEAQQKAAELADVDVRWHFVGQLQGKKARQVRAYATAILMDATIVRTVLVPATMELLGDRNWWFPAWLDRLVPNIAVEGPPDVDDDEDEEVIDLTDAALAREIAALESSLPEPVGSGRR